MHFELKLFETDKESGYTKIRISYNLGKVDEIDERGFNNPEWAQGYVKSMKASFLQKMIELYVGHAGHIFNSSKLGYYQETARLRSLERLQKAVKIIAAEQSLTVIASYVVSSELLLKHILPHSSNPSFDSSEERFTVMMQVAKPLVTVNPIKSKAKA